MHLLNHLHLQSQGLTVSTATTHPRYYYIHCIFTILCIAHGEAYHSLSSSHTLSSYYSIHCILKATISLFLHIQSYVFTVHTEKTNTHQHQHTHTHTPTHTNTNIHIHTHQHTHTNKHARTKSPMLFLVFLTSSKFAGDY